MSHSSPLPDFEERMRQLCQADLVEDLKKEIQELKEALKKATQNGSPSNAVAPLLTQQTRTPAL